MGDSVRAKLFTRIGTTDDVIALRGLRDQIHEQMALLQAEQPIEQFYTDLNEVHDALIRRAISLSEAKLARMGHGSPPVPYAYLLFGSGGRQEQTLSSDQDSGLIYENPANEAEQEEIEGYFRLLSDTIVATLQAIGYPPCEGNVISSNPLWCQSLSGWQTKLDGWFQEPNWECVRYLLIVADCRCVFGQEALLESLKSHYYTDTLVNQTIVQHMLNNTMRHKVLIGVFGQLLKEQYGEEAGSLDLKYGAYIPMVNAIRLMSIKAGVRETSTLSRIAMLSKRGVIGEQDVVEYRSVFNLFMRLRLMTMTRAEDGVYTNSGKLPHAKLTKPLIDELKAALRIVKKLQRLVQKQTRGRQ
ncbi:DUF294 nucleotidyltransferase-like domain-containing protein [Paenibacillus albus]|uniref:CBS domain-containing protein n=1 Tax=Paenibacillus albus TaxID=2495582 RepID=A0A3Q8X996_9BACL|nr:DUF294 nucleotidyltransferase-like domain-containing protein [Paenibacillus albus]AZN42229.1 hypothetical protein EJC50_23005 [Paenibacillus albus]